MKTIILASDHAGYALKQLIVKEFLSKEGINFQDLGTNSEKSVDYPKFAKKLFNKIYKKHVDQPKLILCLISISHV